MTGLYTIKNMIKGRLIRNTKGSEDEKGKMRTSQNKSLQGNAVTCPDVSQEKEAGHKHKTMQPGVHGDKKKEEDPLTFMWSWVCRRYNVTHLCG
jgi:hypothetical protein